MLGNLRKGSMAIMDFGEKLNSYLDKHKDISVDRDQVLTAFIKGKIDYDLTGLDKYLRRKEK